MSRWLEEHRRDQFYKLAKKEGYRSRAAYKLLQANQSFGFIKPGYIVVDLGCAPGGWLQAASKIVGSRGKVLGVDIRPMQPLEGTKSDLLEEDITNPALK
ncbi:MAG: RlmE family RNA methyltransferase, partial [Candidatus Bathyarchaeota archaeon]